MRPKGRASAAKGGLFYPALAVLLCFVAINALLWQLTHDSVKHGHESGDANDHAQVKASDNHHSEHGDKSEDDGGLFDEKVGANPGGKKPRQQSAPPHHEEEEHPAHETHQARRVDNVEDVPEHYVVDKDAWPFQDMEEMVRERTKKKHWVSVPSKSSDPNYDTYMAHRDLFNQTGCDLQQSPFDPKEDSRCIDTLTDTSKWGELIPLAQGFDQRTIKFDIDFLAEGTSSGAGHGAGATKIKLQSILKVPQRLFPNEAFSEVAAYHADRILGVNRIPPTGWVCIPTTMIRKAVSHYGPHLETVQEFLQESGVKSFEGWVEKDLMKYAKDAGLLKNKDTDDECVGASIQLHMADVGHLLDSALKIPYIPHNASWHRYFNLRDNHDDKGRPIFYKDPFMPSLVHIAEISMFDFVIGNDDRSPNKNNFVVGGCTRHGRCGPPTHGKHKHEPYLHHFGHPTYVHLDQGMGFYVTPSKNPITKSISAHQKDKKTRLFCFFRAPLLNRIRGLHERSSSIPDSSPFLNKKTNSRFAVAMADRLPVELSAFLTPRHLHECMKRMQRLLDVADRCLEDADDTRPYMLTP